MKIKVSKTGIFFKLENQDWNPGYGKAFIEEVKKLPTVSYNPPEIDDVNWWFVGADGLAKFKKLKEELLNKPIRDAQADKDADYKPIPRRSQWARKRVV